MSCGRPKSTNSDMKTPPTEAAFHYSEVGGLLFAMHAVWGGSLILRQALVSQKAPVGWPVHQGTAFLTSHVIRGYSGLCDFIFCSAAASMLFR
jgi:hypothetical protein